MRDCSVHYMATTDLWATPQDLFDRLNAEFQFTTDVCALPQNAKCERFFSPEQDGLLQQWSGACFMNPPFKGRGTIDPWIEKAYQSAYWGAATVVCLVPSRTGSPWFWNYCSKGEIRFLKGKVKFIGGGKSVAPFNSAVVVFHRRINPDAYSLPSLPNGGIVKWVTNFREGSKNQSAQPESAQHETTINV